MDIRHMLASEHANIRQLTDQIMRALGGGVDGRDNLFAQLDLELRRHLALMEDVVHPALNSDPRARAHVSESGMMHRDIRHALSELAVGDKDSRAWTDRFNRFTEQLDRLFQHHSDLVAIAREALDPTQAQELLRKYERAKIADLRAARYGLTRRTVRNGAIAGSIIGAVALALGATVRRRRGRSMRNPSLARTA